MTRQSSLYDRIVAAQPGERPFTSFFETAALSMIARTLFPGEARPLNWLANRTRLSAPFQWQQGGTYHAIVHDWDTREEAHEFTGHQQARMRRWARHWADGQG